MSDSISQLVQALDTAQTSKELDQIISRIAQIGEPAIPELLKFQKTHYVAKASRVMKIYQLMGYPANRMAIPSIVTEASIINSPGCETAIDILIKIGEPAIPEVRENLRFCFKDLNGYASEIQGLCVLLELMGSPLIDPLMPELLHLLEEGTDENYVDEYALWPIQKIGSPKADSAVQVLSRIIMSKRAERIRNISINALPGFNASVIRPLVPVFRDCLSDPSEAVRSSAKKVLESLGEVS